MRNEYDAHRELKLVPLDPQPDHPAKLAAQRAREAIARRDKERRDQRWWRRLYRKIYGVLTWK